MKKISIALTLVLMANIVIAQNPLAKQWDYRFGGANREILYSLQPTFDKGFILGGYSNSGISGDITQPAMGGDFWIIKIDSIGIKQWDRRYGGTNEDGMFYIQQTADSGYIMCGRSLSGVGGDKTEPGWGGWDYWIIKIDAFGTKQWDKDFGGLENDIAVMIRQTADGGYIIAGECYSGMSGDKTQANWDPTNLTPDYWIIKTDAVGNKQWDRRFGGIEKDVLTSLGITPDGGYLVGGYSESEISGDKTQNTWGTYDDDFWIVKIDSSGNKVWDKDFGGTGDDILFTLDITDDGGIILGGVSNSDVGGDKTQPLWDTCAACYKTDLWIVKTDFLGNKQWEKAFGAFMGENGMGNITQTTDGGYLLGATSYSAISGDKTENNLGREQTWIVKIDSLANKQWDKTLHTACDSSGHDELGLAYELSTGCYIMANYTTAGIGGDKTQANWDTICFPYCKNDFWIIKFCDTTAITSISQIINSRLPIAIYPNPTNAALNFYLTKMENIIITNVIGEIIFETNTMGKVELDVSFLSAGIYFLKVGNEVRKFVKE